MKYKAHITQDNPNPNLDIMKQCWNAMVDINPNGDISHPVEDWVIENFIDRCLAAGYEGDVNCLETFWFIYN